MKLITAAQAADIRARDAALHAWMGERCSYRPSELPEDINPPSNVERSSVEVYEFITDPPEQYFLYIREQSSEATTFMGERLGSVAFGSTYRDNFGGKRQSIVVQGVNGRRYYGTYYKSAGNYARIKQYKNQ